MVTITAKRIISLLMGAAMIMTLAGCGKEPEPNEVLIGEYELTADHAKPKEDNRAVKFDVDSSWFTVENSNGEVVVDIESNMGKANENYGYELNGNKVTLMMTEEYYSTFRDQMLTSVKSTLVDIVADTDQFDYVTNIDGEAPYEELTIMVDRALYSQLEEKGDYAPGAAAMAVLISQEFTVEGITGCTVRTVDAETGEELSVFTFPSDMDPESIK